MALQTHNDGSTLIDEAYSSNLFAALADVWQQALTEHLQSSLSGDTNVLNWRDPADAVAAAEECLTAGTQQTSVDRISQFTLLLRQMLANGQNLHHPRYIGHQVPASVPVAGLFDAVGSITNQPMAIFEMGPWATAIEHALVRRLCSKIGWNLDSSTGLLTHGGSLANLTALLTARNIAFPQSWSEGTPQNAVLVVQSDAHYCVARAAGILGLGTRQVIKVGLDNRRRMDPEQLDRVLQECRSSGQAVLAVAAAACATPIGAFDPLPQIAEICERYGVWLHVDAAHGGSTLMSSRHRHLVQGIELADSVVWDAHKLMFVPALCAAVLYRQKAHRYAAFQQDAPYLYDASNPGMAEYDNGMCTVECTKRSTGFGLWGLWSMFGDELFADLIDRTFALAETVHQMISDAADFEACHVPECNIVVFRHLPPDICGSPIEVQNEFQLQVRRDIVRSGAFYIVQTVLDGRQCLRLTVMNPATQHSDLKALLDCIRETGRRLLQSRDETC
ncbi:MAG: aminotransferase class I/II-fold pyridoxal phosphate-dependent enzyme [Planctomycetaceae bacterium]